MRATVAINIQKRTFKTILLTEIMALGRSTQWSSFSCQTNEQTTVMVNHKKKVPMSFWTKIKSRFSLKIEFSFMIFFVKSTNENGVNDLKYF